ncbi:unnamed protein product [Prunus brigantina]
MPWIIPKCVIYENQYWCCTHGIILSHISASTVPRLKGAAERERAIPLFS